ncbi:paraquat-inducible protein A [Alteromonas halophila]|uniref:Paraquat-inducible protein A n=1 Tax=Alteromonas halophila TaxID=516698 RepID=A0A918JEG8_9ALTE|nr:paraquat-inducible protein A [Alteromonas halophila]GGW75049.1 paraquat-inducible protein A [Alteromonas halophila]
MPDNTPTTVICAQCQHSVQLPELAHRQRALCPRCGHTLLVARRRQTEKLLALSISALVFLFLSLPFNFLSFRASGQQHSIDLPGGLNVLIAHDALSLAIITGIATLILPGLVLLGFSMLSIARLGGTRPPAVFRIRRLVDAMLPWSMAEIFLVGTLVSLIKITEMADVAIGLSFYAFIGFSVCMTAALVHYNSNDFALWLHRGSPPPPPDMDSQAASWSIQRTWALLITAALLYIPANMLPIMQTELFGRIEPNTIIGGVIRLWDAGSYPVALIILIASVIVPVAKIAMLGWLNYTVQAQHQRSKRLRMRYYRITEYIGRWSMIDVFVVAVLVALIQSGNSLSVYPGQAALAFCAVVFITMIAAMTFDSRLIWFNRKQLS